jgi:hypothetical protein
MRLEKVKKLSKVLALGTLAVTVQPTTNPNHPETKPAGVREALKRMEGVQNTLPDGRKFVVIDTPPDKKPSEEEQEITNA